MRAFSAESADGSQLHWLRSFCIIDAPDPVPVPVGPGLLAATGGAEGLVWFPELTKFSPTNIDAGEEVMRDGAKPGLMH